MRFPGRAKQSRYQTHHDVKNSTGNNTFSICSATAARMQASSRLDGLDEGNVVLYARAHQRSPGTVVPWKLESTRLEPLTFSTGGILRPNVVHLLLARSHDRCQVGRLFPGKTAEVTQLAAFSCPSAVEKAG
jgi:hypothetical protein